MMARINRRKVITRRNQFNISPHIEFNGIGHQVVIYFDNRYFDRRSDA
jgi:hypothetical protein